MRFCLLNFLILISCRLFILPESQREVCKEAVHSWHVERVINIEKMEVPDKIKFEMISYSLEQEETEFQAICN
jgi:hypothetical protein